MNRYLDAGGAGAFSGVGRLRARRDGAAHGRVLTAPGFTTRFRRRLVCFLGMTSTRDLCRAQPSRTTTHQLHHPTPTPATAPQRSPPRPRLHAQPLAALQHALPAHCSSPPAGSSHRPRSSTTPTALHPDPHRFDRSRENRARRS